MSVKPSHRVRAAGLRGLVAMLVWASTTIGPARVARAADPASDAKSTCSTAYQNTQRLRQAGKLREAKAELAACEAPSCAEFIRSDCAKWDAELADAIPTVVIGARGADGRDLTDVRVTVDDSPVADKLDGRPVEIDPGEHKVRYESGGKRVDDTIVVRQGEKNRQLVVDFGAAKEAPPSPASHRHVPTGTWILGGVAAVALVSFGAFAIAGKSKEGCAPTCSRSDVDTLRRDYLVADISLGVGVVAAAAAVWIYFAKGSTPEPAPASTTALTIRPSVDPRGGGVSFGAAF